MKGFEALICPDAGITLELSLDPIKMLEKEIDITKVNCINKWLPGEWYYVEGKLGDAIASTFMTLTTLFGNDIKNLRKEGIDICTNTIGSYVKELDILTYDSAKVLMLSMAELHAKYALPDQLGFITDEQIGYYENTFKKIESIIEKFSGNGVKNIIWQGIQYLRTYKEKYNEFEMGKFGYVEKKDWRPL